MFTQIHVISSNDVDCFSNLKISTMFQLFQEAAMSDSFSNNSDSDSVKKKGLSWVIIKTYCEIYKYPKYRDTIKIRTYAGDDLRMFYPRYFVIEDEDGNALVKVSAIWGLIDSETRHLSMEDRGVPKFAPHHEEGELPLPKNIAPAETRWVEKRKIYYSELDFNSHLNNVSYIKMLVDLKSKEFYEKYSISKLNIFYKKELTDGDFVDVFASNEIENYIEIKKGDELCFSALIDYSLK